MTRLNFILEVSRVNMLKYLQVVYPFSLRHNFYAHLTLLLLKEKKNKTVKGIATLILVKIWKYIEFCTFFKNLLHCQIPALTVEW
jgi:hypothetical protein